MTPERPAPHPEPATRRPGSHPHEPRDSSGNAAPIRQRGRIPRDLLDEHAVFVVRRLQRSGHEAYLVGGCVRDLLAGLEPKDFDVATDARPNRIKRIFRSARVIGRRFRLVHVHFPGDHIVEASTFRGDPGIPAGGQSAPPATGDRPRRGRRDWRDSAENAFGTATEDAFRRDFTVNALFYDPIEDEVIDWVGGLEDMERGIIRSIGDPVRRLREDPVRMLRAVHFALRMDFEIEPALAAAIASEVAGLENASQARLYVELIKMLSRGRARGTFLRLRDLGLLRIWMPELAAFLDEPVEWPSHDGATHEEAHPERPGDLHAGHATWNLLGAADRWGLAANEAPESLALAVLFGPWLMTTWRRRKGRGFGAFIDHVEELFRHVAVRMNIPRWATREMRDALWMLDDLRHPPPSARARRLVCRPAFRTAVLLHELDLVARGLDTKPVDAWRALAAEEGGPPAGGCRAQAERSPSGRRRRGGRRRRRGSRHRGRNPRDGAEPGAATGVEGAASRTRMLGPVREGDRALLKDSHRDE